MWRTIMLRGHGSKKFSPSAVAFVAKNDTWKKRMNGPHWTAWIHTNWVFVIHKSLSFELRSAPTLCCSFHRCATCMEGMRKRTPLQGRKWAFFTGVKHGQLSFGFSCRVWEMFLISLVIYSAWACPFEFAFLTYKPDTMFVVDNVVNGFFAIDIILTFFVAYLDRKSYLLIDDPKKIATRSVRCLPCLL